MGAVFFCMFFVPADTYPQEQVSEDTPHVSGTVEIVDYVGPVSPWIGLLFNIVPGFGTGSFIQGDSRSGFLGLTMELCGITIMATGLSWRSSLEFDFNSSSITASTAVTCAGFLLAAGSILFQLVYPFTFYERQLQNGNIAYNKNNSVFNSLLLTSITIDGTTKTICAYRFSV